MHEIIFAVRAALLSRKGVAAAEYAVLAAGIVLAVAAAAAAFAPKLTSKFEAIM